MRTTHHANCPTLARRIQVLALLGRGASGFGAEAGPIVPIKEPRPNIPVVSVVPLVRPGDTPFFLSRSDQSALKLEIRTSGSRMAPTTMSHDISERRTDGITRIDSAHSPDSDKMPHAACVLAASAVVPATSSGGLNYDAECIRLHAEDLAEQLRSRQRELDRA